jgi:hypothetical protein
MSEQLTSKDLINESLDEEMERKGTSPYPDWLNVKKQVCQFGFGFDIVLMEIS